MNYKQDPTNFVHEMNMLSAGGSLPMPKRPQAEGPTLNEMLLSVENIAADLWKVVAELEEAIRPVLAFPLEDSQGTIAPNPTPQSPIEERMHCFDRNLTNLRAHLNNVLYRVKV